MKAIQSVQVEAIEIDDMVSITAMCAFAGSVLAGAVFWAAAIAVLFY